VKIYLINLDRASDRLEVMTERLKGIPFERFPAIDGKTLDYEGLLTRNEAACVMSHRVLWQRLIDSGDPYACILEDDIEILPRFFDLVQNTDWLPSKFDSIKLETFSMPTLLQKHPVIKVRDRELKLIRSAHWGTAAYIISRGGAERMLDVSKNLDRPTDWLLYREPHVYGCYAYQVIPAPCRQDAGLVVPDQLLNRFNIKRVKPKGLKKLSREIRRPFGDLWQWLRSRRWKSAYETVEFS
jgi:glycosyl transferase family 25